MNRRFKLELIGPTAIVGAMFASEMAALALAHRPDLAWLWYLNLRVFGLFQQAHYYLDGPTGIAAFGPLFIGLPILVFAWAGFFWRHRLMMALASNASFIYALFLIYSYTSKYSHGGPSLQASLRPVAISNGGPDLFLLAGLLVTSIFSAWVSHVLYVRAIRNRR